jgi:transcription initiation factor TFIIE subunit alpha
MKRIKMESGSIAEPIKSDPDAKAEPDVKDEESDEDEEEFEDV